MPGRGGDGGCTAAGELRELGGSPRRSHITAAGDGRGGGAPLRPPRASRRARPAPARQPRPPRVSQRALAAAAGQFGGEQEVPPSGERPQRGRDAEGGAGNQPRQRSRRPTGSDPVERPSSHQRAEAPRCRARARRLRPRPGGGCRPSGGYAGPRVRDTSSPRPAENKLLPRNYLKQRSGPRCPDAAGGTGPSTSCAPRRLFPLFGDLRFGAVFLKFGRGWRPGAEARWHYSRSGLAAPPSLPPPKLPSTFGTFPLHPLQGPVTHRVLRPPPQVPPPPDRGRRQRPVPAAGLPLGTEPAAGQGRPGAAVQNTPASPRADKAMQTRRGNGGGGGSSAPPSPPAFARPRDKWEGEQRRVKFYGC